MDARNGELVMLLGLLAIDLGDEKTAERALVAVVTLASRRDSLVPGPGPGLGSSEAPAPSSSRNPSATLAASTRTDAEVLADSVTALFHLASMAHAGGDVTKARRWLGKALQADPTHAGSVALLRRIDGTELDACAGTR
jgi:hypothetical protein